MIINRAPARGGRGRAGERSERGGRTRPRGSSKPRRLLGHRRPAGFGHGPGEAESSRARSAPLTPSLDPTGRSNLSAWPAPLCAPEGLALRHGDRWVRSPRAREARLCPRRLTSQLSASTGAEQSP